MKYLHALTVILLFLSSPALSQDRHSGQMVVPIGWENQSLMRFTIDANYQYEPFTGPYATQSSLCLDTLFCNFGGSFGGLSYSFPITGMRKGYASTAEDPRYGTADIFNNRYGRLGDGFERQKRKASGLSTLLCQIFPLSLGIFELYCH
jgi:hypothetical protein